MNTEKPASSFGRAGFAFEAPPSRGFDSVYVSDGAGEPYTAGRGESDDAFQYYSRHPLPRVGAPTGRPQMKAASMPLEKSTYGSNNPMAMTCMRCHGNSCMYQSPSAEPFCADCNRAALQK